MKKLFYCLFLIGSFLTTTVFPHALEIEPRIKAATVDAGYQQYRDTAAGCTDCWTAGIPFSTVISYNNSFYRTGNESCAVNGNVRTCYYEYNIDGVNQYLR
ncbi:MAG: hypothetical protein ACI4PU_03310 [Intestinibacter sp.]